MPPPYRPALRWLLRWPQPGGVNSRQSTSAALAVTLPASIPRGCRADGRGAVSTGVLRAPLASHRFRPADRRGPLLCIRGEVAVSAVMPRHEPASLGLASASQLAARQRGFVAQIGSSHEGSHD
jgi:hypothetical protein